MAAPIVIELTSVPPPPPDLREALVKSCSSVAAGGCTLDPREEAPEPGPDPDPRSSPRTFRARVVVTFEPDYARVRVALDPDALGRAREVSFRPIDPAAERFRAAGLVVAGLVADAEAAPAAPSVAPPPPPPPPPAETDDESGRTHGVGLAVSGRLAWTDLRPWAGVALSGDFSIGGSTFFVATRVEYEHTLTVTQAGISEQRLAAGVGAGASARLLAGHLELRPRLRIEVQDLGASVVEAKTLRSGEGSRVLVGGAGELDALIPVSERVAFALGAELDWLGGSTSILVHEKVASALPAWMYGVSAGLNVRIP